VTSVGALVYNGVMTPEQMINIVVNLTAFMDEHMEGSSDRHFINDAIDVIMRHTEITKESPEIPTLVEGVDYWISGLTEGVDY
jgi:hypothetical protein